MIRVPDIDAEIGLGPYATPFPGLGGGFRIRASPDDFGVREILSQNMIESISDGRRDADARGRGDRAGGAGTGEPHGGGGSGAGYAVYVLKKRRIDTAHALSAIRRITGATLKPLGLKDASAVTEQFVCSTGGAGRRLRDIDAGKFSLTFAGYAKKPITKKHMLGNAFRIVISGDWDGAAVSGGDVPDPARFAEHACMVPNFYGYQRFGSRRPVTHLVGREITRRNFDEAVRLILEFDSPHDAKERRELRRSLGLAGTSSSRAVPAERLPPGMDVERTVLGELAEHGDPLRALRAVPLQLRRLYVAAYQSYLFNRTLGAAAADGQDMSSPSGGDICFDRLGNLSKYGGRAQAGAGRARDSIRTRDASVAVPIVGYSYYAKTRFAPYVSSVLDDEGVLPRDFFIKEMQEVSGEGGFRDALVQCSGYSWNPDDKAVEFSLTRGSFATVILREIIKPPDPIAAGF